MLTIATILVTARDKFLWDGTGESANTWLTRKYSSTVMACHAACLDSFKDTDEACDMSACIEDGLLEMAGGEPIDFPHEFPDVSTRQAVRAMWLTLAVCLAEEQGV
jgi:hypothetical protein